eukprot:3904825-Rhodomonas_salina.1
MELEPLTIAVGANSVRAALLGLCWLCGACRVFVCWTVVWSSVGGNGGRCMGCCCCVRSTGDVCACVHAYAESSRRWWRPTDRQTDRNRQTDRDRHREPAVTHTHTRTQCRPHSWQQQRGSISFPLRCAAADA